MARLEPVGDPSPEQADLLAPYEAFSGGPPFNIFRTLVHQPRLFRKAMALGTELLLRSTFHPRVREAVILRVAWRTGSAYEWGQHVRIGLDAGLTRAEVEALATEPADAGWSAAERLAVAVVDELCATDDLTDSTWADAVAEWGEEGVIELLLLVGNYRMLAGFLNAARVEPDEGLEPFPT